MLLPEFLGLVELISKPEFKCDLTAKLLNIIAIMHIKIEVENHVISRIFFNYNIPRFKDTIYISSIIFKP